MAHRPQQQKQHNQHFQQQVVQQTTVQDVFHSIWAADKARITPIHEKRFSAHAFHGKFVVKVCDARRGNTKDHKLFRLHKWNEAEKTYQPATNAELLADPEYKSFKLVYVMFDNYESDETKPEVNTKEECQEIMEFLNYVTDSEPMKVALAYLRKKFANSASVDAEDKASFNDRVKLRNKLKKIWFDQYDWGMMKSLSGFEHTFVGERRSDGKVMGYHFWYKYLVDDSTENYLGQDAIDFNRRVDDGATDDFLIISFTQFVDTDHDGVVDGAGDTQLSKSFGSFFVGCSAECKIALGTVAYYESKAAWAGRRGPTRRQDDVGHDMEGIHAVINGHKYKLSMHRGGDKNQYCRSFFPVKL